MRASGYDRVDNDWYVESPACVDAMLAAERVQGSVWDPAAGGGNIPRRCEAAGLAARGSDIVQRAPGILEHDFFQDAAQLPWFDHQVSVITNPPFKAAEEFVKRALYLVSGRVIVLQRLAWLESRKRREFFRQTGLSHVWVHSSRISMPPGGSDVPAKGGSIAFAWFVWRRQHVGPPTLGWLP